MNKNTCWLYGDTRRRCAARQTEKSREGRDSTCRSACYETSTPAVT